MTQYDNATVGSGTVVDEIRYQYDDWGPISQFDYDRDSAVDAGGSDDEYSVSYTYAEATGGRNTLRRTGMTLPSGNVITYSYESTDSHDDDVSRVTEVKDGATSLCAYDYLGVGRVVGTTYDEPDIFRQQYGSTSGDYPDIDRFNRVTSDRWTKDLATDRDFFDTDISYDRSGNITLMEDNVHTGFDVSYDIDDLNRVIRAEEGTWTGSSITSRTRDQQWTLDHVGNWDIAKLDLNGDGDFLDTDESDDDRTHNIFNELTGRDTDDNGTNDFTLTYDVLGNLTDDDEAYVFEYDGFSRLRMVKDTSDSSLIAELTYNGLGHISGIHEDTDDDGDVDSNDLWFYRIYDERWKWIATFREDDSNPKEEYVFHTAGSGGLGGSSYIDSTILRFRDGTNTGWNDAADGTFEETIYYCQNVRYDVISLISASGSLLEFIKNSPYGTPFGIPRGDTDSDGETDQGDRDRIDSWTSGYDVRYDVNLDNSINSTDSSLATDLTLGRGSNSGVMNLRGLSGRSGLRAANRLHYFRHRYLSDTLGRWSSRDPLEWIDGPNLYQYSSSSPLCNTDPFGLCTECIARAKGNDPTKKNGTTVTPYHVVYAYPPVPQPTNGWCSCLTGKTNVKCAFSVALGVFMHDENGGEVRDVMNLKFKTDIPGLSDDWSNDLGFGGYKIIPEGVILLDCGDSMTIEMYVKVRNHGETYEVSYELSCSGCDGDTGEPGGGSSGPSTPRGDRGPHTPGGDGDKSAGPLTGQDRSLVPRDWWN